MNTGSYSKERGHSYMSVGGIDEVASSLVHGVNGFFTDLLHHEHAAYVHSVYGGANINKALKLLVLYFFVILFWRHQSIHDVSRFGTDHWYILTIFIVVMIAASITMLYLIFQPFFNEALMRAVNKKTSTDTPEKRGRRAFKLVFTNAYYVNMVADLAITITFTALSYEFYYYKDRVRTEATTPPILFSIYLFTHLVVRIFTFIFLSRKTLHSDMQNTTSTAN